MPLNNVNLMGPNPAQPFDLQTQQAMLQRQAAIAQALIAQSMQDHSPVVRTAVGNPFSRDVVNIGDPIASIAQAYMGKKQQEGIDQQQGALANELQRRDAEDTGKVLRLRQGYTEDMGPPTAEGETQAQRVPGNFIAAVQEAMRSTVPRVKAWGAKMAEDLPSPKDVAGIIQHIDPASAKDYMESGDPSLLKGPKKVDVHGDIAVTTQSGNVVDTKPIQTYGTPKVNEIGVPVQASEQTGKQHAFGQYGDTSTQKSFDNLDAAAQIKIVEDGSKQYLQNAQNMGYIAQVREDMKNVPEDSFGFLGTLKTSFSKAAEALGFDKLPSTASKEMIHSTMGHLVLQKVRALAPVTELDLKKIEEIVGSENNTKRALTRVMDYLQLVTDREMQIHQERVRNVAKRSSNPEQFYNTYAPSVSSAPVIPSGNSPYKDMTDADIMKRLRGG